MSFIEEMLEAKQDYCIGQFIAKQSQTQDCHTCINPLDKHCHDYMPIKYFIAKMIKKEQEDRARMSDDEIRRRD